MWKAFKRVALQSVSMCRQKLWTAHSAALKTPVYPPDSGCIHTVGSISVGISYGAMGNYSESGFKTLASISKNAAAVMFYSKLCKMVSLCVCV